jgi:hypothetical protein
MRSQNFNPEWGYLAPAPSFVRIARVALVAAALGASAGAAVVFSLIERPAAGEGSVAARTLVRPAQNAAVPDALEGAAVSTAGGQFHGRPHLEADLGSVSAGSAESRRLFTAHGPQSIAALAEAPATFDAAPASATPERTATRTAPRQKKAAKRQPQRFVWRNVPREQAYGRPYGGSYGSRFPPVALMRSLADRSPYLISGED